MYPSLVSSLKAFRFFQLFCVIVVISNKFVTGTGPTNDSYNDFILDSRRAYDDLPSSSSIIEECTSGVPCRVLSVQIRTVKALLNELEAAGKRHCPYPRGSEMESSIKQSHRINSHQQQPNHQKPPFPSLSKIPNFGQSTRPQHQKEESHFSPRQLFRQLPLQSYQIPGPYPFSQTDQMYRNNPGEIGSFHQTQRLPIAHKSEVKKSKVHDNSLTTDVFDIAGKRNKKRRRKLCSRRSGKKRIEPKLRIQDDASINQSEDEKNDISEDATSPKAVTDPVTTNSEAERIDSETDGPDK